MSIKSILMVGALCLSTVPLVSAKSYDIHLSSPAVAGKVQLPAGNYKLKVDGANAVLKDIDSDKTYTTPVKVETEQQKYDETSVITSDSTGQNVLKSIELGGSNTLLEFGE
jgi:hypothetical protein